MLPGRLEAVDGAGQIGLNDVGRAAAVAGVHRRLGGAFDEHIKGSSVAEVVCAAHIAVHEGDAGSVKTVQGEFAPATFQVVECPNVSVGRVALEHERQTRADEACSSRNQYSQDVEMISDPDRIDYSWLTS